MSGRYDFICLFLGQHDDEHFRWSAARCRNIVGELSMTFEVQLYNEDAGTTMGLSRCAFSMIKIFRTISCVLVND